MSGISSNALSFASPNNNYKFNGGDEWEESINLYSTFFREYDPQIGRFDGVDILSEKTAGISCYHFGGNNPIRFNDPNGAMKKMPEQIDGGLPYISTDFLGRTMRELDQWTAYMDDMMSFNNTANGGGVSVVDGGFSFTGGAAQKIFSDFLSTYSNGADFDLQIFAVNDQDGKNLGAVYAYTQIVDPYDYAKEGIPLPDQLGGIKVSVGFISSSSEGPQTADLNWIQRVKTNSVISLGQTINQWFTDQTDDARGAGVPYYTTNDYVRKMIADGGDFIKDPSGYGNYTTLFNDRITRYVADEGSNYLNINWTSNLSLVNIKDNSPLIILSYGFTISSGVVTPISFTQIAVSH